MIRIFAVAVLACTSVLLFAFGTNLLYLTWRATRIRARKLPPVPPGDEPLVCLQLPIYNERYVAERVLDAACAMDWPRDRLQIQVLDDSDDDTATINARRIDHWRRKGVAVRQVRRATRADFKAGALAHGLTLTDAPFIAIFDADFVPPSDFLRRTVGAFDDQRVGFVQARWGHLDEGYSLFTRLQAMAIDFHFLVEQSVRSSLGYFTNFTGTAGVWRRGAIEDAGGWSGRTLTEDLDLSYRAQMRGWKAAYAEDLVVPEELPVSIDAYRRQQSRWATGSFQTAFRILLPVLRSRHTLALKVEAVAHLCAYAVGPVMLVQLACYPLFLLAFGPHELRLPWYVAASSAVAIAVGAAPWVGFVVARVRRGEQWWTAAPSFLCQVVGAGMSMTTLLALVRALRPGGRFVRTPKHHITEVDREWRHHAYVRAGDPKALLEGITGLAAVGLVMYALSAQQYLIAVYSSLFAVGFLLVSGLSAAEYLEVATLRGVGRRVRGPLAAAGLLGLAATALAIAAQMPEPFEDGYAHWLIAANLAATGHLHDPLFGMEDTWLPGYHVLAAAVLKLFGLWQLGALKLMGAGFGLATAACVYALAPNRTQARTSVALLVLNPVFLFTSGSAVVEPLVTALLSAGALAAVRGRMKLAALLAALACTTSTKAWIWVGAAIAFAMLEAVRSRRAVTAARVAWAVPAVAVLAVMQLGFAPAAHSVARGSLEVASATVRGSIPAGAAARLVEVIATFGLAALPLLAFGAVGAVTVLRRPASAIVRFVYVPTGAYVAVVLALVAAGAYTGSHRYLYPALPALALLAAHALDRYGATIRVAVLGAAGLLTIGFVPVFSGFAGAGSGLMAAGHATAHAPGVLLTDSPEVAYYSGKNPTDITGSQALPATPDAALAWMNAHRVGALALEDISYYRATTMFPGLAAGHSQPPFIAIAGSFGGGKPTYVYRFMPSFGLDWTAEGKTASLAKGVTLGPLGTGEGMGFGVPVVRYPDGWVYARTSTTVQLGPQVWRRTFVLDTIGGDNAHAYRFVATPPRGQVDVTYVFEATGIAITVDPVGLEPGYLEVGILNEQSALFDDVASEGRAAATGASFPNWEPMNGAWARLRSSSLGLEWWLPSIDGAQLYAGRELALPGFDWAGLDYMFDGPFRGTSYRITVQEAR